MSTDLRLAELAKHSVDRVEGGVDLLSHLIGDEKMGSVSIRGTQ